VINVVHLTPHYGTGVGTVIRGYAVYQKKNYSKLYSHEYLSLENINSYTKNIFRKYNINFIDNLYYERKLLNKKILKADIVLVHWWNHPLLMDIIANHKFPKNRIVLWCHITGKIPPNCITNKIVNFPDKFIFTTPVSKQSNVFKNLSKKLKKKTSTIWSTAGIERVKIYPKKKTKIFNVGYIGNLDFTKLHPNFIKICEKSYEKNMIFTVIGKIVRNSLARQIRLSPIRDKIMLKGYVS
jgi:hypothetical protein